MTQLEAAPTAGLVDEPVVDYTQVVIDWLARFDTAVVSRDVAAVVGLLAADPWWRDLYALTWDVTALHGADDIAAMLERELPLRKLGEVALDRAVAPSFMADTYLEALFTFTTDVGVGRGVVRLTRDDDGNWKAWTVATNLQGLKDYPESAVTIADAGKDAHNTAARPGERKTWAEAEAERLGFTDHEPSVLILGAGHSGLFLAARLKKLGVPALVVDTYARAGDNWRLRYSNLVLHDTKWWSMFPYMPYPETWPLFTPKEMLADWIEAYVKFLQLNLWTSTHVQSATYDDGAKQWTVEIDRDGEHRTLHPNHLVFATGLNGVPSMPTIPGSETFTGDIVHSSGHQGGAMTRGKKVIVVGGGSSGCDVAQDAYENGADVTVVQRGETYVLSQRNGVPVFHGTYYSESSPPAAESDLLATSMPMALTTQLTPVATRMIADSDQDLIKGLESVGFKTTLGPNDSGMMYMSLVKGGGYYIDKGASQLIIDGEIQVQPGEIDHFTETGVVYADGTSQDADLVVMCTGFGNMRDSTRPIVGDEVADTLGLVWGLDEQGELRTTYRHSGHEKLWFMAGGFQQSRVHSRHVALMIQAMDAGLLDPAVNVEKRTTVE